MLLFFKLYSFEILFTYSRPSINQIIGQKKKSVADARQKGGENQRYK